MTPDVTHNCAPRTADTACMEFVARCRYRNGTTAALYRDRVTRLLHEWRWTERETEAVDA